MGQLASHATQQADVGAESVATLLADLALRDIRLTLDGEKLRISAPTGALDAALKSVLAARKPEIIAVLRAAQDLPTPSARAEGPGATVMNELQRRVADVWRAVLGRDRVGLHDNFFDVGGHSLLVVRVQAGLRREMGCEVTLVDLLQRATVAAQADLVAGMSEISAVARESITHDPVAHEPVATPDRATTHRRAPAPRDAKTDASATDAEMVAISFAQQRLWFLDRMQRGTAHYNISVLLRFSGVLDEDALARALGGILDRHEVLRVVINEEGGQPVARRMPATGTPLRVIDLSQRPPETRESEALREITASAQTPFDLARGPMARFLLVRVGPQEHRLLLCMHHIAADGWSLSVAARELCALYDAHVAGRPSPLAPLAIQYAGFATWQRDQLEAGLFTEQIAYWTRELGDAPAVLELPTDRPRPAVPSHRGARLERRVPGTLLDALKALGRAHGATLYMTMLATWQVLLFRYSGQEDVLVGSPVANRDRPEFEGTIGCFTNNIVLRGRLGDNPRFRDFLAQVRATVLRAFDHRDVPFDRVVEGLRPERITSHSPIFQLLFTLHSFPVEAMRPVGLQVDVVPMTGVTARFDLTLEMDEHDGALRMHYEYASDLFDAATVDRLHEQYLTLLAAVVADVDRRVCDLPLLDAGQERQLLARMNATGLAHDGSQCVHDLVRIAATARPGAIAVEADDAVLTYAELLARANQLAGVLRARGVGPGTLVGVCLDRTSWLPVTLLAVLTVGAAYVPVDPTHPADRITYTLRDAGVSCAISESRFMGVVAGAGAAVVCVDTGADEIAAQPIHDVAVPVAPSDLAYVIYTSGSTGRPKGVELEHRNVVNFLRAMQREPGIGADDVLLAVTTPSFDIAGLELFLPLVSGARTVIASRADVLDGGRLAALVERCGATMLQATPATWRLLLDRRWAGKADLTALCGGEPLPRDLALALVPRVQALWNMYGPTETTIWSTMYHVMDTHRDVPIGHPIANTSVYVLDGSGRQAPIGAAGELCIGGEGVARGYWARPELTAEKFVMLELPGRAPERVYRTGDVVRLRADLALEFVGRRDHQVKLRGYRIELGEIESVLVEHPAVRRCAAIVREDVRGDQRLVAYVVGCDGGPLPADALRAHLRARLPEYMVPSILVPLPELPLTPNGKVDRKALPAPATLTRDIPRDDAVVMTDPQRRVAAVWAAVLGRDRVGLYENFFDIGGNSLDVVRVQVGLREEFGRELTVVDLFQQTTVAAQASLLAPIAPRANGLARAQARAVRQVLA